MQLTVVSVHRTVHIADNVVSTANFIIFQIFTDHTHTHRYTNSLVENCNNKTCSRLLSVLNSFSVFFILLSLSSSPTPLTPSTNQAGGGISQCLRENQRNCDLPGRQRGMGFKRLANVATCVSNAVKTQHNTTFQQDTTFQHDTTFQYD